MTAVLPIIAAIARWSAGRIFITTFFVARCALPISRCRVPPMALFGFPWPGFFTLKSTCPMLLSIAAAL